MLFHHDDRAIMRSTATSFRPSGLQRGRYGLQVSLLLGKQECSALSFRGQIEHTIIQPPVREQDVLLVDRHDARYAAGGGAGVFLRGFQR